MTLRHGTLRLVCATLLLTGATARSEPPDSAGQASAERGFAWDFHVEAGGVPVGTWRVAAEPAVTAGVSGWKVSEEAVLLGGMSRFATEGFIGKDLVAIQGKLRKPQAGYVYEANWERTPTGYSVRYSPEPDASGLAKAPQTSALEAPTGAWSSWAVPILLVRAAPAGKATHTGPVLDAWQRKLVVGRVEMLDNAIWERTGKVQRLAVATWGTSSIRLAFDPVTNDLVGVRSETDGLDFVPGPPPPVEAIDFSKPPTTAVLAVLHLRRAAYLHDESLIASAIDWPSLQASDRAAKKSRAKLSEADHKKAVLSRFAWEHRAEREGIELFLAGIGPKMTTTPLDGGNVSVELPAILQSGAYVARRFEEGWKVVRIP